MNKLKNNVIKIIIIYFLLSVFISTIVLYLLFLSTSYKNIKNVCNYIKEDSKDCVQSLNIAVLSEKYTYKQRNDFIWVMGQFADKRSLESLNKLYTGNIPNRENLNNQISQYELYKAIKWCENGNITSFAYKSILKDK